MRHLKWLALAMFLAAPFAVTTANAAPSLGTGITANNDNIVEVARRCGHGYHFVKAHHNRRGRWIKGQCVADRRG